MAQGAKKRQTAQRSAQKSSDRGSSRPNIRGNQAAPAIDIKVKVEETPPAQTNDTLQMNVAASDKGQAIEKIAKEVVVADQIIIDDSKGNMQDHVNGMMIFMLLTHVLNFTFNFSSFIDIVKSCRNSISTLVCICSAKLW